MKLSNDNVYKGQLNFAATDPIFFIWVAMLALYKQIKKEGKVWDLEREPVIVWFDLNKNVGHPMVLEQLHCINRMSRKKSTKFTCIEPLIATASNPSMSILNSWREKTPKWVYNTLSKLQNIESYDFSKEEIPAHLLAQGSPRWWLEWCFPRIFWCHLLMGCWVRCCCCVDQFHGHRNWTHLNSIHPNYDDHLVKKRFAHQIVHTESVLKACLCQNCWNTEIASKQAEAAIEARMQAHGSPKTLQVMWNNWYKYKTFENTTRKAEHEHHPLWAPASMTRGGRPLCDSSEHLQLAK